MKLCPRPRFPFSFLFAWVVALIIAWVTVASGDAKVAPRDLHDLAALLLRGQLKVTLPDSHPYMLRAAGAAVDLRAATDQLVAEKKLAIGERDAWERDAFVWSFFEANWLADPHVGLGDNDNGGACSVLQLHISEVPASILDVDAGITCAKLRKDRVAGYRVALRVLLDMEARCGSRRAALNAYSTNGACHAWEPAVVKERCAEVPGGC